MDWQPIETTPRDGEVVLIHVPGRGIPQFSRGDDYWSGLAHWLEGATHWARVNLPPEPHYEITAQGRAYLEKMKNEQPNSKDAGQATQGRMAPVGGGEVEPRDEDAA